jgi:3-oxoacyl-[acyl-carrier protein] reductase
VTTRLGGKVALVTGASRGIGAESVRALVRDGALVAAVARSEENLKELAAECGEGSVLVFPHDLADTNSLGELVDAVVAATQGVDILVNNAGVIRNGPIERMKVEHIESVLRLNVMSGIVLTSLLVPIMQQRGGGAVINMSSIHGTVGIPYSALYAATKGAIEASTRSLAAELGRHNIRVNAIAPGAIRTDMWTKMEAKGIDSSPMLSKMAIQRWGESSDIANAVVFLASDESSYITGHTLFVDGGLGRLVDLLPDA